MSASWLLESRVGGAGAPAIQETQDFQPNRIVYYTPCIETEKYFGRIRWLRGSKAVRASLTFHEGKAGQRSPNLKEILMVEALNHLRRSCAISFLLGSFENC